MEQAPAPPVARAQSSGRHSAPRSQVQRARLGDTNPGSAWTPAWSGHRCGVWHVTLPTADAFGVRRADLGASAWSGVTGEALAAHLQRMRNGRRSTRCGARTTPRALCQTGEARDHEQGSRRDRRVALAASAHRPRRGGLTMRRRGRHTHTGDGRPVGVVAGHATAGGRVVRNGRWRAVVGAAERSLPRRSRYGASGRAIGASDSQRAAHEHHGRRRSRRRYTRSRRTAHFL